MKKISWLIAIVVIVLSCGKRYDANEALTNEQYDALLIKLAPYVVKKPDELTYDNRFAKSSIPFYKHILEHTGGKISYFLRRDSANFFFFISRDRSSLYEHYRGLGGYYKINGDSVTFLNLLYHTPRLTSEEMNERGKKLFDTMVTKGNVDEFIGNRKYIHTPNADFYYNTKLNRWDYTENSSWKFIEEAKEKAQ
jgi:hypothetical protein